VRIAITGSTGLIGTALARSLESDRHDVVRLVRRPPRAGEVHWDPAAGEIDAAGLEGLDGVVHLAGKGIGDGRWTEAHLREVHDSRVRGTALLGEALASLDTPPPVLVSGSAVGYYGDRGDEVLTEDAAPGTGTLPDLCRAWEAATGIAEAAGIRVVHLRTGIVLAPDGGALGKQLLPFKLGLGGRAGDGRQWFPWVSIDDEVGAIRFLLDRPVSGAVNVSAPAPVRNVEFVKALGAELHRPTVVPIPRFVRRLPLGVGPLLDTLLFWSTRAEPRALVEAGYRFRHPDLGPALAHLLAQ